MFRKFGVHSGAVVAILAQCAALVACGVDDAGETAPGDGDASGDGDGDTGEEDPCDNLILVQPLTVDISDGATEETCRVSVVAGDEEGETQLDCSVAADECRCSPDGELRDGMTLTVTDGDTVLFEDALEREAGLACAGWVTYGGYELDYVELLESAVDDLYASIEATGTNEGCELASDCEAVALGSKPCGGPWSHTIVSTTAEGYEQVVAQASELDRLEEVYNQLAGDGSDCAYETAPEVACVSERCVSM